MPTGSVVHLASQHRASDVRIFQKECRTLARAGYDVTFVVPYDREEVVEGVRIRPVPVPGDGRDRLTNTLRHVYRAALNEPSDAIFHFHDAELLPYMLALKLRGRRVVYDAHEDTPRQIMYQHWIPRLLRRPVSLTMRVLERLGGRLFDGVIVAEPDTMTHVPAHERVLVRNYPLVNELVQEEQHPYDERPMRAVYVGALTRVRGAFEMVEAVRRLPERLEPELVLGGPFYPAELASELCAVPGTERVHLAGWLDRPQVAAALAQARVGLAVLHPTPKYLDAYPTKLFEYMVAGLPVIVSDFPKWRPFVEEPDCGLLVDPHDPGAISEALQWVLEHPREAEAMGQRGRQAVLDEYNWGREAPKLLALYDRLT